MCRSEPESSSLLCKSHINFIFSTQSSNVIKFFLLRELKVIFFTLSMPPAPRPDVSMVSVLMAFSHNAYIIFSPFTCSSSGKSHSWSKAEKDKCICKEPHIVFYLLFLFCHHIHFPKMTYFSERLLGGITGVFITHAVSIALMHYRQGSFLDTVLYLLKKHNLMNLFANSYWTYRIIFSGRYNWRDSFDS